MLPSVGYFQSITCPSLIDGIECQRPYCYFRHSNVAFCIKENASEEVKGLTSLEKEIPHESEKHRSVLHGARGAASSVKIKSKKVSYKTSKSTKVATDLEYDPMCNFNLAKKSTEESDSSHETLLNNDSSSIIDLTNSDLDANKSKPEEETPEITPEHDTRADFIDDFPERKTSDKLLDRAVSSTVSNLSSSAPIVISDSDDELPRGFPNLTGGKNEGTDAQKPVHGENRTATGNRSYTPPIDNSDVDDATERQSVGKTLTDEKTEKTVVGGKTKLAIRKSTSKNRSLALKRKLRNSEGDDEELKAKVKKKPKLVKENGLLKRKKIKLNDPAVNSSPDISKYVSKEEIEKLDKELNDVGMFDECYRIYQEQMKSETSDNKPKPLEKNPPKPEVISKEAQCVPEKSRRVAHTAAAASAKSLFRERDQRRRLLTPAQAMMKRMETIQREQEERLLSSLTTTSSAAPLRTHKPLDDKQSSSRIAHKPMLTVSKTSQPRRLTSGSRFDIKNRKPFQDLIRKSSSTGTGQSTLVKGHTRSAHVPTDAAEDMIQKPRILPDRHAKVPTNLRQRYLGAFIDECMRIFNKNRVEAYKKAETEELQCNSRSKTKTIYLSLAASVLKKLRATEAHASATTTPASSRTPSASQTSVATSAAKVAFKTNSLRIAHNTSPNKAARLKSDLKTKENARTPKKSHSDRVVSKSRLCKGGFSLLQKEAEKPIADEEVYENLRRYLMTEQELADNRYPRPSDLPGTCKFMVETPRPNPERSNGLEQHFTQNKSIFARDNSDSNGVTKKVLPFEGKTCARCGKEFVLYKGGHFPVEDECIHHWGKAFSTKVGSHWEKRYSCCQTPIGSEGCSVGETHVHKENVYDCGNYVRTLKKTRDSKNPGVFALDCEMAFTVDGLELIRVSVVNFDCQLVYDALVQPPGKILDYNTRWSGLSEDDLRNVKTTLRDVQAVLLNRFSSDTILMGHSLESDLIALRIVHSTVIDTSIVFPHRLGPPYKRALRNLMADNLGIIIQNSVDEGHDSMEDASACIKLIKWKLKEDLKVSH